MAFRGWPKVSRSMSEAFDYESAVWGADSIDPHGRTIASYRLAEALAHLPASGRVAEVGCGAGRFLRALRQVRPDLQLVGMDVSRAALRAAVTRPLGLQLRFVEGSALPAADSEFDALLLLDVLEHASDPHEFVRETARILKPGGLLHAHVPCEGDVRCLWHWLPYQRGPRSLKRRLAGHEQRFRRSDVFALLHASQFEIVRVRNSLHFIGNLADVAAFLVLAARERAAGRDAPRRTTGDLLAPGSGTLNRLVRAVDVALWWEARLLGKIPSWGLHISARKRVPQHSGPCASGGIAS